MGNEAGNNERISTLGVYRGFTSEVANGYQRESRYLTLEDGGRIAIDILHPALDGERLDGARPTVLHATPYRRSFVITGKARTAARYLKALEPYPLGHLATQYEIRPLARQLIHSGYNFVSMDLRGTGASFGADYVDSWRAGHDIAQVVGWIAEQPWASARVGMVGISYEGMVQFYTAAFRPEALTCIAPQYPGLPQCYVDGGLAIKSFARTWESLHKGMAELEPAAPVDGPDGDAQRDQALAERSEGAYAWVEAFSSLEPERVTEVSSFDAFERLRDRSDLGLGNVHPGYVSAHELLNRSAVPTYLVTGWWDLTFPGYLIDLFNRLTHDKKLLIGPWNHGQGGDPELLRWFDYWLRGIDNGIMSDAPVHYGASEPTGATWWKAAPRLPLPEAQPRTYYLGATEELSTTRPTDATQTSYDVDHDVSLGQLSRHSFYTDDLFIRTPDLDERARHCLSFTSAPLEHDIEMTGWPWLELELSTSADRGAVVATLEQINGPAHADTDRGFYEGKVAYLTEGFLNLEHRRRGNAEIGHEGPVWHSYLEKDVLPVTPGQPISVALELYPVSCLLRAGDRIRLTLAGADADNLVVPTTGRTATLSVTLGGDRASRLCLPIVNTNLAPTAVQIEGAFASEGAVFAFRRPGDPPPPGREG